MDLNKISALVFLVLSVIAEDIPDFTKKCYPCSCIWVSGTKTANCVNRHLNQIPKNLSDEIRDIDFSLNPIYELKNQEFVEAGQQDLQKLKFQKCGMLQIHEYAFKDLGLLIELDLSWNQIRNLARETFKKVLKLRFLSLSHNNLSVLEDGVFYNLTHLQKIHLDNNQIKRISPNTFQHLDALTVLSLAYNQLTTVNFNLIELLPKLISLEVEGNPWVCDCHLENFRQITIPTKLITKHTECWNPERLRGSTWSSSVTFACVPVIVEPSSYKTIEAATLDVLLTCKSIGEPTPDVDWMMGSRIIEKDPRKTKQKYITSKGRTGDYTWNNLTITSLSYKDRGEYKCIAKNPGGQDERNITLMVHSGPNIGGGVPGSIATSTLWIIISSVVVLVVLLVVLLLVCCFCKKNNQRMENKRREHADSSEEYISMCGGQADIKKGLITDVNPVTKPPRTSVPPSVVSGGTEVCDVKRNLLDNEPVFDLDEESRSLDLDQPLLRKSQMMLDASDYRLNGHYPPDLLPFPPRAAQISPAASSASTVADTTRLPPHHGPQSPLQSPIYDQLGLYRTLPYSRSQSPFMGVPPPRIPRQGYVTIPRRPRQQSWSSEPPNMSDVMSEPLYDNLGARTTADGGSSQLSLNKIGTETASTPRSNRMFPLSPTNCDPIAESHESPPSQMLASQTLPRNMNSKLTPSRTQWAMQNAKALRSPDKRAAGQLPLPDRSKASKVPPMPPPKPKKRVSAGPLFEDEGEDGTEV